MFHPIISAKLNIREPALPPAQPCCLHFPSAEGFWSPRERHLLLDHRHCFTTARRRARDESCFLPLGCQLWCSLDFLEFEMAPGACEWFRDREKKGKSWVSLWNWEISSGKTSIRCMLEAVLQHEKTSAWVVPHWVWGVPMLHEQTTRNWLGWREFSGSPCRLCLYTWQGVCWDCAKSGVSALPCLAHIPHTHPPRISESP